MDEELNFDVEVLMSEIAEQLSISMVVKNKNTKETKEEDKE